MSVNTVEENQRRSSLAEGEQVWLFGYGSLIYLVDFPYIEARAASIQGWSRRFWQGSHDHRGTENHPGRVVTLIEEVGAVCGGMAYKVHASVFKQLDEREKNGYLRLAIEMNFKNGDSDRGLVYIATPDNEAYLGEASEYEIANQICVATGCSGPNWEYLVDLADALREMNLIDQHVFRIESHILEIRAQHSTTSDL